MLYKIIQNIYSIFILYPLKKPLNFQTFIIQAVLLAMLIFSLKKYNAFTAFMVLMIKISLSCTAMMLLHPLNFFFGGIALLLLLCLTISPACMLFSIYLALCLIKSFRKSERGKVIPLPDVDSCIFLAGIGGYLLHIPPIG